MGFLQICLAVIGVYCAVIIINMTLILVDGFLFNRSPRPVDEYPDGSAGEWERFIRWDDDRPRASSEGDGDERGGSLGASSFK